MTILLIAHSAVETITDPRVSAYTSYQLRVHKRARALLQDWILLSAHNPCAPNRQNCHCFEVGVS
jgi:hypothetical protein